MEFRELDNEVQLGNIKDSKGYNLIFKHNTTCPISRSVRRRFEIEAEQLPQVEAVYFLDLLAHRDLSDAIAEQYKIEHESPQLLLIKNGACTYHEALYDISAEATLKAIKEQV